MDYLAEIRRDPRAPALVVGGAGLAAWVTSGLSGTGDYTLTGGAAGDNPAPALDALAHGHLGAAAAHQPLMGLPSLLVRLPAALAGAISHASVETIYRWGVFACLLCAVAGMWAWWRAEPVIGLASAAVLMALALLGPQTGDALRDGHPEELLAAWLAVGAVLAAAGSHPVLAGGLLGAAIATKPWALVAVAPVLGVGGAGLGVLVISTVVSFALLALPLAALDPTSFFAAARQVGHPHLVNPASLWYPPAAPFHGSEAARVRTLPLNLNRSDISLVLGAGTLIAALVARARGLTRGSALALLAALAAARCLLDPEPLAYYYLPAILALGTCELVVRRRAPIFSVLAALVLQLAFTGSGASVPYLMLGAGLLAPLIHHLRLRRQLAPRHL